MLMTDIPAASAMLDRRTHFLKMFDVLEAARDTADMRFTISIGSNGSGTHFEAAEEPALVEALIELFGSQIKSVDAQLEALGVVTPAESLIVTDETVQQFDEKSASGWESSRVAEFRLKNASERHTQAKINYNALLAELPDYQRRVNREISCADDAARATRKLSEFQARCAGARAECAHAYEAKARAGEAFIRAQEREAKKAASKPRMPKCHPLLGL